MNEQNFETISVEYQDDVAIVAIREKRIYMQRAEKFRDEIGRFLSANPQHIIVDLSDVSVMNSAALGVLIALQNDQETRQGKLSLVGLQPLMEEIFNRMRLELLFDIDKSVGNAMKKIRP